MLLLLFHRQKKIPKRIALCGFVWMVHLREIRGILDYTHFNIHMLACWRRFYSIFDARAYKRGVYSCAWFFYVNVLGVHLNSENKTASYFGICNWPDVNKSFYKTEFGSHVNYAYCCCLLTCMCKCMCILGNYYCCCFQHTCWLVGIGHRMSAAGFY